MNSRSTGAGLIASAPQSMRAQPASPEALETTPWLTGPAAVDLKQITHTFRSLDRSTVTALSEVDLEVRRTEFVSIIGPSGCGKSTILRLISGLLKPSSGTVSVFALPVTEPRDDIALAYQRRTLVPWRKVVDNVTFPEKHKTGRVSKETSAGALEILEMVGLQDFLRKRPAELSGGMQHSVVSVRDFMHCAVMLLSSV